MWLYAWRHGGNWSHEGFVRQRDSFNFWRGGGMLWKSQIEQKQREAELARMEDPQIAQPDGPLLIFTDSCTPLSGCFTDKRRDHPKQADWPTRTNQVTLQTDTTHWINQVSYIIKSWHHRPTIWTIYNFIYRKNMLRIKMHIVIIKKSCRIRINI